MSVVFTLTGNKLSIAQWNQIIEAWAEREDDRVWEDPEFQDGGEDGLGEVAYLFGEGSTRGVELRHSRDQVEMRLNALASRRDWAVGFRILRAAVRWGGGHVESDGVRESGEEGASYDVDSLTKDRAHREAVQSFVAACDLLRESMQGENASVVLPLRYFSISIGLEDVPENPANRVAAIERNLVKRIEKYSAAYRGNVLRLKDGRSLSMWALVPSILPRSDLVSVGVPGDDGETGRRDSIFVPFEEVTRILGDRVESLPEERWFFPEIDPDFEAEVIQALRAAAIDLEIPSDDEASVAEFGDAEDVDIAANFSVIEPHVVFLTQQLLSGTGPDSAIKSLIERGLEADFASNIAQVVGLAANGIFNEQKNSEEVLEDLVAAGVPEAFAYGVLGAMAKAMQELS